MNPKSTATRRLLPWLASCLVAIGSLLAPAPAHAQPSPNAPDRLTYQGFLVDANGVALGNTAPRNYDIIFRIYNDPNAGQVLWAEQQTVTVDRGNFSVILGEGIAIAGPPAEPRPALSSIFRGASASERYVALTVRGIGPNNGNADIMPRLRFLASPYAFLAQQATKIVKADGTDLLFANNSALTLDGSLGVRGGNSIELGAGIAGKEANAGRISYGGLTPNTLDIVGGGTSKTNRQVRVWAEGGTTFDGPVSAPSFSGYGIIPVGCIVMWSGSIQAVPDGWALCDGSSGTPDLRSRFIVGASGAQGPAGLTARAQNAIGGGETITLTVGQLPAHTHVVTGQTAEDGVHSHGFWDDFFAENQNGGSSVGSKATDYDNRTFASRDVTDAAGSHRHAFTATSQPTGSGSAVAIMPPFYAMAFIMRVR